MAEKEIFKNLININKSNNIQNKPQFNCNIKPPPKKNQRYTCNNWKCRYCNGNKPRPTKEQLEIIKEKNRSRTNQIPYKQCSYGCHYCLKIMPGANNFIYEKNLEIMERAKQKKSQEQNNQNQQQEINNPGNNQIMNIKNGQINNITAEDRKLFKILKVKGDGNCTIRAILESAGLSQELHNEFRDAMANAAEKLNIEQSILTDNGFNNKKELIDFLRTEGNYIGMEHAQIILEKYNINTNIWLDNKNNGMKWISLNKNGQNQPKIYVNYKDYKDIYPDQPEYTEKIAHYDALISNFVDNKSTKNIIEQILKENIRDKQIKNASIPKTECNILLWNVNSIRDFTKRSYLIQQLYENNIDIALLNETMLTQSNSFYIKGYKIYRADAKFRKGVAILISKSLKCGSYKTIEDEDGRFLQIKLKNEQVETTISTAYVEPERDKIVDILPENITKSELFGGDLNNLNSGLKIESNVYHIQNLGEQIDKINVIKKISDHPILIFKKLLPFSRIPDIKIIKTLNKFILKENQDELEKAIKNQITPNLQNPHTQKKIFTRTIQLDNKDYNEYFDTIKKENLEKFKLLKQKKAEEIATLLQCNSLGHEPYQRLTNLMQYNFNQKFWKENNPEKNKIIAEGFQSLFGNKNNINLELDDLCKKINMQLTIITQDNKTKDLAPPFIPQSRARDANGFSQREILKLVRGNSLSETAQKLINLLSKIYESENSNLFFHRTSKFFFKKKIR